MKKILYSVFALAIAAFTFTSCEDVPAPYDDPNDNPIDQPVVFEPEGAGTQADPFNVAAVIAEAEKLEIGEVSTGSYYFEGYVTEIRENYDESGTYGNGSFYISDDEKGSNSFYVYHAYYFNDKKYTSGVVPQEGDKVVFYGKLTNYNGTLETNGNDCYLVSINGETGDGEGGGDEPTPGQPEGDGTLENPYNVAGVIAYVSAFEANETSPNDVYIKGKVASIRDNFDETDPQFGNATYEISDDGTDNNTFLIYRSLYLGNTKYTSGDVLQVGDEVIVCGKVTNYVGEQGYSTLETVTNQSYLYSLNSVGGGDEPGTGGEGLATVTTSGNVLTMVDPNVTTTGSTVTCDLNAQGFEHEQIVDKITLDDGTVLTFSIGEGTTDPKFYDKTKGVRMYAKNTLTFSASKKIAKIVLTCDQLNDDIYVGNPQLYTEIDGNTWKLVNDWTEDKGGTQLRVQTIEITYAE
ncbi:MAG TPA: hypothetical protein H9986_09000 [Candidatus Prevotella stercoripullorum]|nr:hypothetical protein [Candidatus Prevotella stercoripullorum]